MTICHCLFSIYMTVPLRIVRLHLVHLRIFCYRHFSHLISIILCRKSRSPLEDIFIVMILDLFKRLSSLNFSLIVILIKLFCQFTSSHWRCSVSKGVLGNFAKFTGKYLCQSLFFNKVASVNSLLFDLFSGFPELNLVILLASYLIHYTIALTMLSFRGYNAYVFVFVYHHVAPI